MHFAILLLLLLIVPLVELVLLIEVGSAIGTLATIGLTLGTAGLGIYLFRLQGAATIQRARKTIEARQVPALEIIEGLTLAVAALLLLVPGFMTDFFGFLLLLPRLRRSLAKRIVLIQAGRSENAPFTQTNTVRTLETEYKVVEKKENE